MSGGGPGQPDKKALTFFVFFFFFFFFFFSPQLILQQSNGQFQRNLSFFKVPEGVQHFPGGWGSNCLFPIETHISCDFPGGVRTPCPPLWIRTCSFTAKMVKQKEHFVECFDIIEVEDNFQGKDDIDW